MPLPPGFVVLNNSNIFTLSGTPIPLSLISKTTVCPDRQTLSVKHPPCGIASTAFLQRFKITCFIFAASTIPAKDGSREKQSAK